MKKVCVILFIGVFLALGVFSGCKKKLPTQADTPTVGMQSIAVISSSDMLYIGTSETFTAVATMSDGSTQSVVGGVWSEDNPSVAMVDAVTGEVIIVGSGMVNISVNYQGKQGTKTIRGLPNYQGTWSGSYIITGCNTTGEFAQLDFCDLIVIGTEAPIELNLTQDSDRVEGRILLGDVGFNMSGPIDTYGQLLLSGAHQEASFTIELATLFQSESPGQITGTLVQLWRMTQLSGNGQLSCEVASIDRISAAATALRPSAPRMLNPTLKDLIRALTRR